MKKKNIKLNYGNGFRKAFTIPNEAYYADVMYEKYPTIYIGIYAKNGGAHPDYCEFVIEFNSVAMQLHVYSDAVYTLKEMPELLDLIHDFDKDENQKKYLNANEKCKEFAKELIKLGYVDDTIRKKPKYL